MLGDSLLGVCVCPTRTQQRTHKDMSKCYQYVQQPQLLQRYVGVHSKNFRWHSQGRVAAILFTQVTRNLTSSRPSIFVKLDVRDFAIS